jgi:segregation and condensation protein B
MIVEGMLFVGSADGRPITSRDMAAHIRDVDEAEVDSLVEQLNAAYRQDGSAYEIVQAEGGYRLQLCGGHGRLRDRLRGRVRSARLTPAALEVLSIVAYRPGATSEDVNRLRGSPCYPILSQLVRRQLLRVERPSAPPRTARYHTTDRFNALVGIGSPADLPQAADLDDS